MELSEDELIGSVAKIMRPDVLYLREFFRKLELSNSTSLLSAIRLVKVFDIPAPRKLAKNITKHDLSLKAISNLLKADESDAEIVLEDLKAKFPEWFNDNYKGSCDRIPEESTRFDDIMANGNVELGASSRLVSEKAAAETTAAASGSSQSNGLGGSLRETQGHHKKIPINANASRTVSNFSDNGSAHGAERSPVSSSSSTQQMNRNAQAPMGPIIQVIPNSGLCDIEGFTCTALREGMPSVGCPDYPVRSGKWYYEVTLVRGWYGPIQIGWADTEFRVAKCRGKRSETFKGVGDDDHSWAADGFDQSRSPGKIGEMKLLSDSGERAWMSGIPWEIGDVIGCSLDVETRTIQYHVYKSETGTTHANLRAFEGFSFAEGLYPCVSIEKKEVISFNFGTSRFAMQLPKDHKPYFKHLQSMNEEAANAAVQASFSEYGPSSSSSLSASAVKTPNRKNRGANTTSPSSSSSSSSSSSGSAPPAVSSPRKYTLKAQEIHERWLTLRREKLANMRLVPFDSLPKNLEGKTIIFRWKDHDNKLDVWEKATVAKKNKNPDELLSGFKWNVRFLDTITGRSELRACELSEQQYLHSEEELMHSAEWVDKIAAYTWAVYERAKSSSLSKSTQSTPNNDDNNRKRMRSAY